MNGIVQMQIYQDVYIYLCAINNCQLQTKKKTLKPNVVTAGPTGQRVLNTEINIDKVTKFVNYIVKKRLVFYFEDITYKGRSLSKKPTY